MKKKITGFFSFAAYWSIVLVPFSMAIASGPMNVFMAWMIVACIAKHLLEGRPVFTRTSVTVPLLALALVSLVSMVHTINMRDSLRGAFKVVQYLLVLLSAASEVKDRKHIWRIIVSGLAGISLVSIDALWQVLSGKDFIRGYLPVLNIGLTRATASFSDSNVLGIYLSALVPLAAVVSLYVARGRDRLYASLVTFLGIAGIALTYSRPTVLALWVSLMFVAIVKKDKILALILIAGLAIVPLVLPSSVKDWARSVEYHPVRVMCNDDRIAVWQNTLNMIKTHPFIGVGVNTYMKNYRFYKNSPEYRGVVTAENMYAHNNFLHMAGEIGLLGCAVFAWFLWALFREAARMYRRMVYPFLKAAALGVTACLIGFLANGLTESSLYYSRVALLFWYLTGFLFALQRLSYEENVS